VPPLLQLANQDSYRLSILGFPGNPTGPQNLGLLDQRLAIEWVRDNIENFGGDPSRIILFGQSAGGASTDFYSYAWSSDPIVSGLIVQSGTSTSWGLPYTPDAAAAAWYNVSATVGCGDSASDSNSVLSCMRSTSYSSIITAIPVSIGLNSVLSIFGPTVDEKVVFSHNIQRTPARLPLLLGSNNYESGLFRTRLALKGFLLPDDFWEDANLQHFTCPAGIRANASVAAGNPTWRYRYFGEFANLAFSSDAGSWHGAELPMIFDKIPAVPPPTMEEVAIGNYMRKAWTSFAKDPVGGLTNYGLPAYDPDAETLVRLAWDNQTGTNAAFPSLYDGKCGYGNVRNRNAILFSSLLTYSRLRTEGCEGKVLYRNATDFVSIFVPCQVFFLPKRRLFSGI